MSFVAISATATPVYVLACPGTFGTVGLAPLLAAIGGKPNFSALSFTTNKSKFLYGDFYLCRRRGAIAYYSGRSGSKGPRATSAPRARPPSCVGRRRWGLDSRDPKASGDIYRPRRRLSKLALTGGRMQRRPRLEPPGFYPRDPGGSLDTLVNF